MMIGIDAVARMGAVAPRAATAAGFRVAAPGAPAMPAAVVAMAPMGPLGAVAPSARDMAARRRASGLLAGLSALQLGLLGGRGDPTALSRLPDLLEGEEGDDPDLAELLRGMALRARIEWDRRNPE